MELFDLQETIDRLYNLDTNPTGLIDNLDGISGLGNIPIRVIPFSCEENPVPIFSRRIIGSREVTHEKIHNNITLFKLSFKHKVNGNEVIENGRFFLFSYPNLENSYVVITIENAAFFQKGLQPFIEHLYPKISLTFLSHKYFTQLLFDYAAKEGPEHITIVRASVKFRLSDHEEHRRKMSAVIWPSMSLDSAFNWVQTNNAWFQSLQLKIPLNYGNEYSVTFTRNGIIQTDRKFKDTYTYLIAPVCQLLQRNCAFFGKRSREQTPNRQVRPIVIDFPFELFLHKEENIQFIDMMKKMTTAAVSTLHGNPYIHLGLLDYFDGSTFDIWVLSPKRIIIAPQIKASIQAIRRIINHIFDTFAEGKILDYSEITNG